MFAGLDRISNLTFVQTMLIPVNVLVNPTLTGGDVAVQGDDLVVTPRDGVRQRAFIAPSGLWLTLDAGKIQSLVWNVKSHTGRLILGPSSSETPRAYLRINQSAIGDLPGNVRPLIPYKQELGAYTIPLSAGVTIVPLSAHH